MEKITGFKVKAPQALTAGGKLDAVKIPIIGYKFTASGIDFIVHRTVKFDRVKYINGVLKLVPHMKYDWSITEVSSGFNVELAYVCSSRQCAVMAGTTLIKQLETKGLIGDIFKATLMYAHIDTTDISPLFKPGDTASITVTTKE